MCNVYKTLYPDEGQKMEIKKKFYTVKDKCIPHPDIRNNVFDIVDYISTSIKTHVWWKNWKLVKHSFRVVSWKYRFSLSNLKTSMKKTNQEEKPLHLFP